MFCEKLEVPETYFDNVPPNPRENKGHIVVKLGIDILTILGCSEVESTVSLQYVLMLEWVDSRVMFKNLKKENYDNKLDSHEVSNIWYPRLLFFNTEDKEKTKVLLIFFMPKITMQNSMSQYLSMTTNPSFTLRGVAVPHQAIWCTYTMTNYSKGKKIK